jgi:hypothetical protein
MLVGMDTDDRLKAALRATMAEPANRSPLFWWMLKNHDWMIEAAGGRRMRWTSLGEYFAERGLTDMTGNPPTIRSMKQTWLRAMRR